MCKIIINVTKPSAQPSQVCIKDYNRKFEHLFNDCCEILASFSKTFSRYIYFNVSLQLLHVYKLQIIKTLGKPSQMSDSCVENEK